VEPVRATSGDPAVENARAYKTQQMMFDTDTETQDRGQVGIGTLIVFIALVLVAAIAAGVLINTAGFLQSQAESTGQESTDQVSNGLQVTGATAEMSGGSVDNTAITLSLSPGSDPIDIKSVRFEIFGDVAASVTPSTNSDYGELVKSGDGVGASSSASDKSLDDETEYVVIQIDTDPLSVGLSEGDEVELVITAPSGAQTTERLSVPDPAGSGSVNL